MNAPAVIIERQPWGRDAHTALRWAFNLIDRDPYPANLMAQMRTGSKARGDLSPLELRAEAAKIRRMAQDEIASTHPVEASYITAYYLPLPAVERKAGGGFQFHDHYLGLRRPAINALAQWLMIQRGTGVHRIRGYQEIIAQHVYGYKHIEQARKLLAISFTNATKFHGDAEKALKDLRGHAVTIVQGKMETAGML